MSIGEWVQGICWLLLIVGSVGWLTFGLGREWQRRHRRAFRLPGLPFRR